MSQYGWTVLEVHRDQAGLYLIEDGRGNRYHIPCDLWDSLKSATEKAQEYRKSRNYFREARDQEKKNGVEICERLVANHNRLINEMNNECIYYQDEIRELEGKVRNYKALLVMVGTLLVASICYIFLI